ncbi:MAG TPA: type II secretion system F family protein, partial [Candidatus Thermoplasmatota archaeon]|nr:type II secretion system F family protein [Candidatus Thermoplasmatota archaeon]
SPMASSRAAAAAALLLAIGDLVFPWPWLRWGLPPGIVAFAVVAALLWPQAKLDTRRSEIDNALPFFMTHFGVLSTANIPRTEIFRILAGRKEYKALAGELERLHGLVVHWNMALPEACRFVSRSTPSQILGDFLERLAHAMETGQDLAAFLQGEQSVVMKEYATVYETSIYQIEKWKDLYTSSMMSGAFFVIFAIIMPIISGGSPQRMLMGTFAFVLFLEVILLGVLKMRTPADRLWHRLPIETPERRAIRRRVLGAAAASALLAVPLYLLTPLGAGPVLAIAVAPLAGAGWLARQVEERIKRREDNYAAFIRSLGASVAARGGSLREVMRTVRQHNFGPLSDLVDRLYARLSWRLDDGGAWKHFSAESGSHLVDSFTDMFIEGIQAGGKGDQVGQIISDNVVRILNLRKARYSTANTFRGTLNGLTASMAFVMFIGVGILGTLGSIFAFSGATAGGVSPVNVDFRVDQGLIEDLVLLLVAIHCFIAAWMTKMVDGGSLPAGLLTLVVMVWITVALSYASAAVLPRVFNVA